MSDIPEKLRELVNAQLMDNETIQWIDRPIPNFFTVGTMGAFFLAIPWMVFVIFGVGVASGIFDMENNTISLKNIRPEGWFYITIGIPVVLLAMSMIYTPLWKRRKLKHTIYAITNLRAIVAVRGTFLAHTVTSYFPSDFWYLSCEQKANGIGNLYFSGGSSENDSLNWRGFMNIRNVTEVERILQELKRQKLPE